MHTFDPCSRFVSSQTCCSAISAPYETGLLPSNAKFPVELVDLACQWCFAPLTGSFCFSESSTEASTYCAKHAATTINACGTYLTDQLSLQLTAFGIITACILVISAVTIFGIRALADRSFSFLIRKAGLFSAVNYLQEQEDDRLTKSFKRQCDRWAKDKVKPHVLIVEGIKNIRADILARDHPAIRMSPQAKYYFPEFTEATSVPAKAHPSDYDTDTESEDTNRIPPEEFTRNQEELHALRANLKRLEAQLAETVAHSEVVFAEESRQSIQSTISMSRQLNDDVSPLHNPAIVSQLKDRHRVDHSSDGAVMKLREEHHQLQAQMKALKDRNLWLEKIVRRVEEQGTDM